MEKYRVPGCGMSILVANMVFPPAGNGFEWKNIEFPGRGIWVFFGWDYIDIANDCVSAANALLGFFVSNLFQ